jgi:hypothetical protein
LATHGPAESDEAAAGTNAVTRIHFVSAPGGSAFMHELLTVVAHEVSQLAAESPVSEVTVSEGALPVGADDDVYVVVPHEYFVVLPSRLQPEPAQLARTIGFCVEHPGSETFETTVREARHLAACVAINDDSTAELNARGIPAERFVLGYTERWDRWRGADAERLHDVVYLGTHDERRSRLLAIDSDTLNDASVLWAMPPHEPMTKPRPDFFMGEAKLELLAASKTLLNLHRGRARSLEWVRVLEAMCNGCVVVSEYSDDFAPLRPGKDLVLGRPRTLMHLARSLLADPSRLAAIRTTCYELIRTELTLRTSALVLAQLAADVRSGSVHARARSQPLPRAAPLTELPVGQLVDETAVPTSVTRLLAVRRPWLINRARPPQRAARGERGPLAIDAAIVRSPGAPDVSVALGELLPQLDSLDAVVHLCFDRVDRGSVPDDPRIVAHGGDAAAGVGCLLNEVLDVSDAAELLVLSAGDRLASGALEHLRSGLHRDRADAAYGMVVTAAGLLTSALPFEPDRVAREDYLQMAAVWRRASLVALDGWSEDPDIDGAETWDLWRRLAARGGTAVLVPRPLVHETFAQDPPLSRYELDPIRVGRLLRDRVAMPAPG